MTTQWLTDLYVGDVEIGPKLHRQAELVSEYRRWSRGCYTAGLTWAMGATRTFDVSS